MKKLIFLLVCFSAYLIANEITVLKQNFYNSIKQDQKQEIRNIISNDEYYHLAIKNLTDSSMMVHQKITTNDPEELKHLSEKEKKAKIRTKTISLPNYPAALIEFKKSVDTYNNPLSAYIANSIMKTKIPARTIKEIKFQRKCIDLLYKTTLSCSSYIDYADAMMNGIGGKPNLDKAYSILKESKKCYPNASNWQKSVIEMKILRVKFLEKNR